MQRKQSLEDSLLFASIILIVGLSASTIMLACIVDIKNPSQIDVLLFRIATVTFTLAVMLLLITWFAYGLVNQYQKGSAYGKTYAQVQASLRKELINAGYYEDGLFCLILPRIKMTFSDDLKNGQIRIENTLHYDHVLQSLDISSAIGKYVVERQYPSDDRNWMIYEIYNPSSLKSVVLRSTDELRELTSSCNEYQLMIDDRTTIRPQHALIVGSTGSGKTYFLYFLILQMLMKKISYDIWLADPKRSSLYVLGCQLNAVHNECFFEKIISMIHEYHSSMLDRTSVLGENLHLKLDADYRDFGMEPKFLIIDEYAAFAGYLQTLPKQDRDKTMAELRDIVLMGRQLGFFLIIVMQKSDATSIPTMLRDNLTFKTVLGNAEDTTYVTAFGQGVKIPVKNFKVGEGVYTEAGSCSVPRIIAVPTLSFDINQAALAIASTARGACNDPRPIEEETDD